MGKRNVVILGINDGHDSGAALVRNGQVISAVHEERLNNIKHYGGVPEKSLQTVFNVAKIDPSDVNLIALASLHPPGEINLQAFRTKTLIRLSPLLKGDRFIKFYQYCLKKRRSQKIQPDF
jgi:carbamoyltransferase